ncbi:hypothetical protein DESPIGER_2110 [Desulfovibrio piger]|uniref:Uncharacterized protein n=1 Tax=Desulfovibrio piger TaxID=901 RepID=A0A1K1LGT9_9BACT|nr:hypothetical protein DESPIGER_2110 [Desulfovibrio piger]
MDGAGGPLRACRPGRQGRDRRGRRSVPLSCGMGDGGPARTGPAS